MALATGCSKISQGEISDIFEHSPLLKFSVAGLANSRGFKFELQEMAEVVKHDKSQTNHHQNSFTKFALGALTKVRVTYQTLTNTMLSKQSANYLAGYPLALTEQVQQLIAQGQLAEVLLKKYPIAHNVRTDKALYDYVLELKSEYLRNAEPLSKVAFDSKLHVIQHALGTHTRTSRVQGINLKTKREIRVAAIFKEMPAEFLRMIAVHELAHIKERQHDKAFYQLCRYMEPGYHQLEFDLRTYLAYLGVGGVSLWSQ